MKAKTLVVMITLLTIVATGTVTPAPVRADSSTALIIVGSIAAYVGFVVVGTTLYRRTRSSTDLMPTNPSENDRKRRDGVGFVQRCPQTSGNLTLVCW